MQCIINAINIIIFCLKAPSWAPLVPLAAVGPSVLNAPVGNKVPLPRYFHQFGKS